MNERFTSLASECVTTYIDTNGRVYDEFDKEKFAELIVNECAKVMEECGEDIPNIWKAVYDVKGHFGVK